LADSRYCEFRDGWGGERTLTAKTRRACTAIVRAQATLERSKAMTSYPKVRQPDLPLGLVLAALIVGALAAVPLAPARADRQTAAAAATIQVKGGEIFFRLSTKTAKPGKTTFVFKNIGHVSHDFKIHGKKTPLIAPGKTARLVVTLQKGKYSYLCTVPGHAAAGMKGVFTVR
jgi:uncharacterized cupredoxin-like copper-binding protein